MIKKLFLTLCTLICFLLNANAQQITYPDWFKVSFMDLAEDLSEANEADRTLVLVFHQDGCPYCKALVERNFSQQNIVDTMNNHFDAIALNMWGDVEVTTVNGEIISEKQLAEQYSVQFTPTLLFLNNDGSERLRLNGYIRPPQMLAALNYIKDNEKSDLAEYIKNNIDEEKLPIQQDPLLSSNLTDLRAVKKGGAYALLFEQEDCSDCKAMHDNVLSNEVTRSLLERLPTAQLDRFSQDDIISFDGTSTSAYDLGQKMGISYTPTWVIFDANHKEIIRLESTLYNFHTQAGMEFVLDEVYLREPAFQRYINERGDRLRSQGAMPNISE